MENFFYICLFIFWTLFWSFASVLIYRLNSGEKWIMNWRSHCPKCNNTLWSLELIPVFSWLKNLWKCHYCKEKVSSIYPFLELSTWILFALIWYFLIDHNLIYALNWFEIIKLLFWLSIWFITILYVFYDLLFLEIHEWIMLSWVAIMFLWLTIQSLSWYNIIDTIPLLKEEAWMVLAWYLSIPLGLLILWGLYIIMIRELKEWMDGLILLAIISSLFLFKSFFWINLTDITILNWIISALIIFIFFFIQIVISRWAWMWGWDLRIAIMIWLWLWIASTFPWLMITYMVWSVLWILFVVYWKLKNKWTTISAQVPFWPFLAIWFFITIFYSNEISNLMNLYLW